MPSRRSTLRSALLFVMGCTAGARSFGEGARDTIEAMGRYLGAVVQLFSGTQKRVEGIEVASLDANTRDALRSDIDALVRALDSLLAPKGIFVQDLRGYLSRAQANRFDSPAQREGAWRAIQGEVNEIARGAQRVLAVVTRPESRLDVVIPDADRVELEDMMRQRGILLARFVDIPPPTTPGDLAALEVIVEQHERLRQLTQRFRVTLESKRRTLVA